MLDPIEEKKYADLKALCLELKMPVTEMFIGLKLHDENGILQLDDKLRGHSWTRNWYNFLACTALDMPALGVATFGAGFLSTKTTSGTIKAGSAGTIFYRPTNVQIANGFHDNSVAGDYGIVVGTGSTAFSINDFNMATRIVSGNAASQLLCGVMGQPSPTYSSKTWAFDIPRVFNNNSGASIVVAEIGLVYYGNLGGTGWYLMERTVLPTPVTLVNGGQLAVTYSLSIDFSAID